MGKKKKGKRCYNEIDTFKVILSLPNGPLCLTVEKMFYMNYSSWTQKLLTALKRTKTSRNMGYDPLVYQSLWLSKGQQSQSKQHMVLLPITHYVYYGKKSSFQFNPRLKKLVEPCNLFWVSALHVSHDTANCLPWFWFVWHSSIHVSPCICSMKHCSSSLKTSILIILQILKV